MANTNPAGPFQPMRRHPRPVYQNHIIGADAAGILAQLANPDTLYPISDVLPDDPRIVRQIQVIAFNAGLDTGEIELVLTRNGREYAFSVDSVDPSQVVTVATFDLRGGMFEGAFLRYTTLTGPVSAYITYTDRRDVLILNTVIDAPGIYSLQGVIPEGVAYAIQGGLDTTFTTFIGYVFNFNAAPVDLVPVLAKTNGVSDGMPLGVPTLAPASTNPGVYGQFAPLANLTSGGGAAPYLTSDTQLQVFIPVLDNTGPVEIFLNLKTINQGPVNTYNNAY